MDRNVHDESITIPPKMAAPQADIPWDGLGADTVSARLSQVDPVPNLVYSRKAG